MRIRSIVTVAGLGVALAAGCGADMEAPADDPPASAGDTPAESGDTTQPPATEPGAPATTGGDVAAGPCPLGTWRLSGLAPVGQDGESVFSGGGSLVAVLTADNRWTVEDDGSQPLQATVDVGGVDVTGTATVRARAEGRYTGQGGVFVFEEESSNGSVTLAAPGYDETLQMDSVLAAIVPTGRTTVTCDDATMTIAGDRGTWTFEAVPGTGGGSAPDLGTGSAAPAPSPAPDAPVAPAIFNEDGTTGSFACGGQDIVVNAAAVSIELSGDCGTLTVNGDDAEISVASAASIVINGDDSHVTYRGNPEIVVNGTGSTADRE